MFGDSCSVPLLLFLCTLNKSSSFILSLQIIFLNLWSFLLLHSELFSFSPHFTKCAFPRTALWAHPVLNRGILRSLMIFFFLTHVLKMNLPFSSNNMDFVDSFSVWSDIFPHTHSCYYRSLEEPSIYAPFNSFPSLSGVVFCTLWNLFQFLTWDWAW